MAKNTKKQKSKCPRTNDWSVPNDPEEVMRILANLLIDKIYEDKAKGTLRFQT